MQAKPEERRPNRLLNAELDLSLQYFIHYFIYAVISHAPYVVFSYQHR